MANPNIGRLGETTFRFWCDQAGLISNQSVVDATGWDFLVEFPAEQELLLTPSKIHTPSHTCKVQVKATNGRDKKVRITLSNLKRLVTEPLPTFLIYIEFDHKNTAQNAYLRHLDEELTKKVLKEVNDRALDGKGNSLNKSTMTITFNENDRLASLDGVALKTAIFGHIGDIYSSYIQKKLDFIKTVGFEEGQVQLTFQTYGLKDLNDLIDVSLGIKESAEISNVKQFEKRFGRTSKSTKEAPTATLSIPQLIPSKTGVMRFKEDAYSPALEFEIDIFFSPLTKFVEDDLKRFRISSPGIELVVSLFTGAVNYSFNLNEILLPVQKFKDLLSLYKMMTSSRKGVHFEFEIKNEPKFEFALSPLAQDFPFALELKALESAMELINNFGTTETIEISFEELIKHSNSVIDLGNVVCEPSAKLRTEFSVDSSDFDKQKPIAQIVGVSACIGKHMFGVMAVLQGNVEELENGRYRLHAKNKIIEKKLILRKGEIIKHDYISAILKTIEDKYMADHQVVHDENLESK